jgi:hypothetical protein
MAAKNPQTMAKRARELAVKEKRDRKRAKKAERAVAAANGEFVNGELVTTESEAEPTDGSPGDAA